MYTSIDKLINTVKETFKDDKKIGDMFEKCFLNTINTTIKSKILPRMKALLSRWIDKYTIGNNTNRTKITINIVINSFKVVTTFNNFNPFGLYIVSF